MRSRLILNLGLAVLLGALLLLAFYQPGKKEAPKPQRLVNMESTSVQKIRIERTGQDAIELSRDHEHWQLQTPLKVRANATKVRALLRFLATKTDQALDTQGQDLQKYGLAQPQVTVIFDDQRFMLGDANPVTAKRYIQYQDRVYATTDSIYHDLLGEAASFASLSLLPVDAEPERLILPGYTLQRDGAKWTLTPEAPQLTGDALTSLVDDWRRGQAVVVKPIPAGGTAISKPEKVRIEFPKLPPIEYLIIAREPELVLQRPDLQLEYHLFADKGARLLQPQMPAADAPTTLNATPTPAASAATAPAQQAR